MGSAGEYTRCAVAGAARADRWWRARRSQGSHRYRSSPWAGRQFYVTGCRATHVKTLCDTGDPVFLRDANKISHERSTPGGSPLAAGREVPSTASLFPFRDFPALSIWFRAATGAPWGGKRAGAAGCFAGYGIPRRITASFSGLRRFSFRPGIPASIR